MKFYGKSYMYNTPCDGFQEVGVVVDGETMPSVRWVMPDGAECELLKPTLTPRKDANEMQRALDAFARKKGLFESQATVNAAEAAASRTTPLGDASAFTALLGDEKPVRQTDDAVTAGVPPEPVTAVDRSDGENEVTAVDCSNSAPALARAGVTVDAPETMAAAETYIRKQLQAGVHAENRIGVVLVWMLEMSGKKVSQFMQDARQTFNVSERQLYTYLKGGRLLLSAEFAQLPDSLKVKMICGACQLELLAPVAEKGAGVLKYFLEHNDPRAMTREELDLKVDLYMTKLLPEAEKEAAEKKAHDKAKEKSIGELRRALKSLADIPDDELVTAARRVGAARVFDHGLRMVAAAVDSQIAGEGTVTHEAVAQWRASLEAALAELGKIGQQ